MYHFLLCNCSLRSALIALFAAMNFKLVNHETKPCLEWIPQMPDTQQLVSSMMMMASSLPGVMSQANSRPASPPPAPTHVTRHIFSQL